MHPAYSTPVGFAYLDAHFMRFDLMRYLDDEGRIRSVVHHDPTGNSCFLNGERAANLDPFAAQTQAQFNRFPRSVALACCSLAQTDQTGLAH